MVQTRLGPYRIERRLAEGGMAEVFVAQRLGPHGFSKRVALKRILPQHARDPEFVGLFIDEARLAARLAHPNIVQVFDFGEQAGSLFMAMELVEGTTVGRLLRAAASQRRTVPLGPALHVAHEACTALAYAHLLRDEAGAPLRLVHRDVSPANLLLTADGHVKLTDFGIARCRTTVERTDDGHIRGKLGYMSPEQVVGAEVDAKSDIFTLTVVLAELLVAEPLFGTGADLDVLLMIRNADRSVLRRAGAHIPEDVTRLLEWGLSREPAERPSAKALAQAFRDVLQRRGELGQGAGQLSRLLQELELVPRLPVEHGASDPGPPALLGGRVNGADGPPSHTVDLGDQVPVEAVTAYDVRWPGGKVEGPLAFSEVVRRIVTGAFEPGTLVRRDEGAFEVAGRMPELRRYFDSPALQWGGENAPSDAARRGFLFGGRLLAQVHRLTAQQETGALHLWDGDRRKKIYYVDGRPDFVASNQESELLGEFLVARGIILRMELEMALALLPRYDGRLGDALVGLGILRPVELYRAVAEQVRARFLEAFTWTRGQWAYVRGSRCEEETFPLPAGEHELLRDAAMQPSAEQMAMALRPLAGRRLRPNREAPAPVSAYRLPQRWEHVLRSLDGHTTLAAVEARERTRGDSALVEVRRALYLGLSCELVKAA
ncbi:MAG: protein kinase [Sandaracinaceae bacterium]